MAEDGRNDIGVSSVVGRIVAPCPTIVPGSARRKACEKPDQGDEGLRLVEHLLDRAVVLVDFGLAGLGEVAGSLEASRAHSDVLAEIRQSVRSKIGSRRRRRGERRDGYQSRVDR